MSPNQYFFNWQNPILRSSIYPFREEKLRDFLRIYKEIDLWASLKNLDPASPAVLEQVQAMAQKAALDIQQVTSELNAAIAERMQVDTWFARVSAPDEKTLRFKRVYYLDRMIADRTQKQAELIARQKGLLRRLDWYAEGDPRRQTWTGRAAELDAPLAALQQDLDSLQKVRSLYDKLDRLPKALPGSALGVPELARAQVNDYEKQLEAMDHDALVKAAWEKLQELKPDGAPRFEKWYRYMVIHFSGMRYMSAHGSWADPLELLDLLVREDLKGNLPPGVDIDNAAESKIQELLRAPEDDASRGPAPVLKALVLLKEEKAQSDDPLPDWVWKEVTKFTQLRLGVQDPNWEATDPQRWDWENERWREIMNTWEKEDITAWRTKHAETLDLIVTRAVCNEVAEHIQHLRGNLPPGGLTAKPSWYLRRQQNTLALPEGDPRKCYLHRISQRGDFVNGASILFLGWTDQQPNPWQVALFLQGIDLVPGTRVVDGRTKDGPDWNTRMAGNSYYRTRQPTVLVPSVQDLRRKGMTDREIEKYRLDLRAQNAVEKEYLRWKHEATVVEVAELIDGPSVLTFETGKIGLNWHDLDDMLHGYIDDLFIGYVPKAAQEPPNLESMLDESKILMMAGLPQPVVDEA